MLIGFGIAAIAAVFFLYRLAGSFGRDRSLTRVTALLWMAPIGVLVAAGLNAAARMPDPIKAHAKVPNANEDSGAFVSYFDPITGHVSTVSLTNQEYSDYKADPPDDPGVVSDRFLDQ